MENASKALLIAGAILICILLIAIGMYIYNSAQGTINTAAGQMGQQEKEMYNSKVQKYIGDSKKGSDVKLMIEEIISNNNQNVGESGKFISVHNGTKPDDPAKNPGGKDNKVTIFDTEKNGMGTAKMLEACKAANVYENTGSGDNTQTNIDNATKQMRAFAQRISSGKNYKVEEAMEDGIIYAVYISPLSSTK